MFQTVTAVEPMPIALPTAVAAGPVSTSASATAATSTSGDERDEEHHGRSFQNGRPSRIS